MRIIHTILTHIPVGAASLTCVCLICYLTLVPRPLPEMQIEWFEGADKVVHALMMTGMMICLAFDTMLHRCRKKELPQRPTGTLTLWMLGVMGFGGVIELLQMCMQMGRGAEWADLGADCVGAIAGWLLAIRLWNHGEKLISEDHTRSRKS